MFLSGTGWPRPRAGRRAGELRRAALRALLALALLAWARPSSAQRALTLDALDRLEELLDMRREDGLLDSRDVVPTLLVSAQPRYEESQGSFEVQALIRLTRVFGNEGVRLCEGCMRVRTQVRDGRVEQSSGPIGLDEIIQLDERFRGEGARARTATWVTETRGGVALRIVDLKNGRLVFAQNVDPLLLEQRSSSRSFRLSEELERRSRGESLTHIFYDVGIYPGQHVSLTWNDQWGTDNSNLSGLVLSFYDPVLGIGAAYNRVLGWQNMLLGAQAILSIPTAVAQGIADTDEDLIDPIFTGVFTMRVPFGRSNYAALLTASTNGEVALGITLLNSSFIPVLP